MNCQEEARFPKLLSKMCKGAAQAFARALSRSEVRRAAGIDNLEFVGYRDESGRSENQKAGDRRLKRRWVVLDARTEAVPGYIGR